MSSLSRKQRRGKVDMFGNRIPKRPFNNAKRTKGRKLQKQVEDSYHAIKDRLDYVKWLGKRLRSKGYVLTEDNWKQLVRKFSDSNIHLDDIEKDLLFDVTNP